jgi:hypothetical protein
VAEENDGLVGGAGELVFVLVNNAYSLDVLVVMIDRALARLSAARLTTRVCAW